MPKIFKAIYLSAEDKEGNRTISFVLNDNDEPIRLNAKKPSSTDSVEDGFCIHVGLVGLAEFESATSTMSTQRSNQLSYNP